jgi:predicted acyltransferase
VSAAQQDDVIVIHPPLNGDPHAIAEMTRDQDVTTIVLPDPAASNGIVPSAPAANALARAAARAPATRAYGVDAYRGFFLLLMTFAMTIPLRDGLFPDWMYHMQYPAPGEFVDRAGLTWRDLLFPAFLFTMCAAIPITNSLRLDKGMPYPAILWTAVKRFAVLYLFALIIGHTLPYWTQDYTKRGNIIAIAGFITCWPLFMRRPAAWNEARFDKLKQAGWIAGAVILFALPLAYGSEFSLARRDGIIHALAFVSLVTTTLWLFTRTNPLARLAVFGIVLALKVLSDLQLPGSGFLAGIEIPAVFQAWMVELLIVAIPATIAGDMLVKWMRIPEGSDLPAWTPARLGAIAAVCIAFIPTALVGFYLRYSTGTALALAGLSGLGLLLVAGARGERETILASLFRWAAVLLVAGAIVEPIGAGIKKDPQTLSYLVVTAGASLALLIVALIAADVLKLAKRATRLLVDVGQNPLIAYVAFTMFFNNLAWLLVFPYWQAATAAQAIGVSIVFTAATALIASAATRKGVYWRA